MNTGSGYFLLLLFIGGLMIDDDALLVFCDCLLLMIEFGFDLLLKNVLTGSYDA